MSCHSIFLLRSSGDTSLFEGYLWFEVWLFSKSCSPALSCSVKAGAEFLILCRLMDFGEGTRWGSIPTSFTHSAELCTSQRLIVPGNLLATCGKEKRKRIRYSFIFLFLRIRDLFYYQLFLCYFLIWFIHILSVIFLVKLRGKSLSIFPSFTPQ